MNRGVDGADRARFGDGEYLRAVLLRLYAKGVEGWRFDPEGDELARYATARFAGLARKYGLDPADGGTAAFEAMRNPAVAFADDPWAVVVDAVRTSLAVRRFADDVMCSEDDARRGGLAGCSPQRFSDRDTDWDNHPNVAVTDPDITDTDMPADRDQSVVGPSIAEQTETIARFLAANGWPYDGTVVAVEAVLRGLAETDSRRAAYESLRRTSRWRAVGDMPAKTWTGLLRLLLGSPSDWRGVTEKGRGILIRLALDETITDLACDQELRKTVAALAPKRGWRRLT